MIEHPEITTALRTGYAKPPKTSPKCCGCGGYLGAFDYYYDLPNGSLCESCMMEEINQYRRWSDELEDW